MSADESDRPAAVTNRQWLADHIGRLAGIVLGTVAFAFLAFLAAIGFFPALGAIIFLVAGIAMIAIGGAMRKR